MIDLGALKFEDSLLEALRDGTLVVFAGAGVSMGAPSNLPSFRKLAEDVAKGTGHEVTVPYDRFLGLLQSHKVAVHERVVQSLSAKESQPNRLHTDLLRLFGGLDRVKLVTTNFDLHFQAAAEALFGRLPEVFKAPALPLGYRLKGIVHVHGALTDAQDLVVTDADFGRAYLTEGWARRFLVDVFRRYTVLFVGYSHDDVVMNYLARALPAESLAGRYALTHEDGNWELLGIKPIRFNIGTGDHRFAELNDGVSKLADWASRGTLDWQSRLAEIAGRSPPIDDETANEIDHALREVHTTRFFTDAARDAAWPEWLDGRGHLNALFDGATLNERDDLLAWWVARHYAVDHAPRVFGLLATHHMKLNAWFWYVICREVGTDKSKVPAVKVLRQWVAALLACAPVTPDHHALMWLAERASELDEISLTLTVFLFMGRHRFSLKEGFAPVDDEGDEQSPRLEVECPLFADHWALNEVWTTRLRPSLADIAQPLLAGVTSRLDSIHRDLAAWGRASSEWDPVSFKRSAIEDHEQDKYREPVDVLIDAARDASEWLGGNEPTSSDAWIELLTPSDAPLLRRLAIHSMTARKDKAADTRLEWLVHRVGLHRGAEHHEVFRALASAYPEASQRIRQAVLDDVLAHELPADDMSSAEERSAYVQFSWLSWLLRVAPECPALQSAIAPIKEKFPDFKDSEHPDFSYWVGAAHWVAPLSPWSTEELLSKAPAEKLDDLLNFKGDRWFNQPDRNGLGESVKDACKQQPAWSFALADALLARSEWQSDLWDAILQGWREAELSVDEWRLALSKIGIPELQRAHGREVADLLYSMVREAGKANVRDVLDEANVVALSTWTVVEGDESAEEVGNWINHAINRPAGIIVEFWLGGLSLLTRDFHGSDRHLPAEYRQWFNAAAKDPTSKGGMARTLLASQIHFLFGLDAEWTTQVLIPLFSDPDRQKFRQAWGGFLSWGKIHPAYVEAMLAALLAAVTRLDIDLSTDRRRFLELYAAFAVFHVNDPTDELIPVLFRHGAKEDRSDFAAQIGQFLLHMQQPFKRDLWGRWLERYWENRLQAVPAALTEGETRQMIEWLPNLDDAFPAGVLLATRSPAVQTGHSLLLYQLNEGDLAQRYSEAMAELLIHLAKERAGIHVEYFSNIAGRLVGLPAELHARLNESLARIGGKLI